MAIEQRVNGAFRWNFNSRNRWNFNSRKSPDQALSNLPRAPTGVLALHVQDVGLHLERKLMGIAIRAAASVG
jgi:hypothetical protein